MKIAVEGCCHGQLDTIYATIAALEQQNGFKVDLLLVCGDVQTFRNEGDLETMACPPKYRAMGTFYKYYSGELVAPVPTIFIGGNHEASNYLHELFYGGWVAPNMFYLGASGVVKFGGVRIGGLSGIFKAQHFHMGHFETSPFNDGSLRSVYHVREFDMLKLHELSTPLDIMLSHDWPGGIAHHGDLPDLLRRKGFLAGEVHSGELGSPPAMTFLQTNRPAFWFAAHMHVKFAALVNHGVLPDGTPHCTRFLALDKCLPRRQFLQIFDVPERGPLRFEYDPEWLAITSHTAHLVNRPYPSKHHQPRPLEGTIAMLHAARLSTGMAAEDVWTIPHNFRQTAPVHSPGQPMTGEQRFYYSLAHDNPQTLELCAWLRIAPPALRHGPGVGAPPIATAHVSQREDVAFGLDEAGRAANAALNPDEIDVAFEDEHAHTNPEEVELPDE